MVRGVRFLLILLCVTMLLSGGQPRVNAESLQQGDGLYSLAIYVLKPSRILVRIDDQLRFSGRLSTGFHARWSGSKIFLDVEKGSEVEVTLNDQYYGILGASSQPSVLSWPSESAQSAPLAEPTSVPTIPVPPTATPVPPTATLLPPTSTPVPPTATLVPPTPTATLVPPTATLIPPTSIPPTATLIPPTLTATLVPATAVPATLVPATAVPTIAATTAYVSTQPVLAATAVEIVSGPQDYYYTVKPGDMLSSIAEQFDVAEAELARVNRINDPSLLQIDMQLLIPNYQSSVSDEALGIEAAPVAKDYYYIVGSGDMLKNIAAQFDLSTKELAQANALTDESVLQIGMRLRIPNYESLAGESTAVVPSTAAPPLAIPTAVPPTAAPTAVPPTAAPPTAAPTAVPPTAVPPTATPMTSSSSAEEYYYTVRSGEMLKTIAAKFNFSTKQLAQANGLTDESILRVGTRLLLPDYQSSTSDAALGVEYGSAVPTVSGSTEVASSSVASAVAAPVTAQEYYYTVKAGDALRGIATQFDLTLEELAQANGITNPSLIRIGMRLKLPNYQSSASDAALGVSAGGAGTTGSASGEIAISPETTFDRLTLASQAATNSSPYYYTTYVTYYGRPNVPVMGILGEYSIDGLIPLLKSQAAAYDVANGPQLRVKPVFHLVYGMASKGAGRYGTYLSFLEDEVVQEYIDRAREEGFDVILDIQIGAMSPAASLALGFEWLKYPNVHLGLDPEFAMSHAGQVVPGNPIGFVTAGQVNEAQWAMQNYMQENGISGSRILLLHQFMHQMIVDKPYLDSSYSQIDLTISVDGWGGPWNKISKYNAFVNSSTEFSAFKLFYQWDQPVLSEAVAIGADEYSESHSFRIETTPNLIIYQ